MNLKIIFLLFLLLFTSCQSYVDWLTKDSTPKLSSVLDVNLGTKSLIVDYRSTDEYTNAKYWGVINRNNKKVLAQIQTHCIDVNGNEIEFDDEAKIYIDAKSEISWQTKCPEAPLEENETHYFIDPNKGTARVRVSAQIIG